MVVQSNQLNNWKCTLDVVLKSLSELSRTSHVELQADFSGITFLEEYSAAYTPANDAITVINLPAGQQVNANFLLIAVDRPTNFLFYQGSLQGTVADAFRVGKFYVCTKDLSSGTWPATLQIDGRLAPSGYLAPMQQGQPVNYYVLLASVGIS